MKTMLRAYEPATDWPRIRQFVIDTFALYQRPYNWLIDRWNFCLHCVLPLHSYYNVRYFGVPTRPLHIFRDETPHWEASIGVWEDVRGEIVAVAHSENEEAGEAWFQIHPDHHHLYDEMVAYAEEHLADRVDGVGYVKLYVNDGSPLESVALARGYRKVGRSTPQLVYEIDDVPEPQLPEGFRIKSVADEDDVDKRRSAKAIAFGANYAPSDWAPAEVFRAVQQAPDYRPDLDLFVVAPNGDYASFCTIWVDAANRYAVFEPVGTHADYQRQGIGRALLMEGFRRMKERGATRSFMESNNEFYRKIGFCESGFYRSAWIKHFPV